MRKTRGAIHCVLPDTQVKPSTPTVHLNWIGRYIVDQFAGRENVKVIHLGDHWHMDSLSSYEKGKKSMEGRRIQLDIEAGNAAFDILCKPMEDYNAERKAWKEKQWWPERHFLLGNHEDRISRAVENDATLEGFLSLDLLNAKDHGWQVHPFLDPVEIDGVSYCLAPDHRVLMADLSYKRLGDVRPGDQLIGFDEMGRYRAFQPSSVLATDPINVPRARVTLSNGDQIDCTWDHRVLARGKGGDRTFGWVPVNELRVGMLLCHPFDTWDQDNSREAGWMAGLLDGEGTIGKRGKQGVRVSFAQNEGPVLTEALRILDAWGVGYNIHKRPTGCVIVHLNGTLAERLKFLGRVRPLRLLEKFDAAWLTRMLSQDSPEVVSIEDIGVGEVIQISTSSRTLIADGYAHHNCHYFYNPNTGKPYGGLADTRLKNIGHSFVMGHQQGLQMAMRSFLGQRQRAIVAGSCYLHDETYRGPQANDEWRGILVLHEVEDGDYDAMEVSLNYLSWRYTGKPVSEWMVGVVA